MIRFTKSFMLIIIATVLTSCGVDIQELEREVKADIRLQLTSSHQLKKYGYKSISTIQLYKESQDKYSGYVDFYTKDPMSQEVLDEALKFSPSIGDIWTPEEEALFGSSPAGNSQTSNTSANNNPASKYVKRHTLVVALKGKDFNWYISNNPTKK